MKYLSTGFNLSLFLLFMLICQIGEAQVNNETIERGVYVDKQGIMRWEESKEEIKGFGVNYTTPFAHAYRSAVKLGIDPLKAIDEDVYHFSRLDFDLYRVHVWDTEISDTLGNLIFNEHLNAFDYLLKKLSDRNINYVITPIAFWGNGWPEPEQLTPGFANKYGKGGCLTNPDAIKAQQNYLFQFMNHVNPYTGVAYKNDPHLIAIEISNEPHHREAPEKVTEFIRGMVAAVRKTDYKKPIFYNVSHSVHLMENYFEAGIQGGTFQWYPTGLGYQRELQGNILPNVDQYLMPFDDVIKKNKGAKIVYEFDNPDVGRSYVYPAMARSFRTAGIQIATQFAYDPMFLAYANTEYNTHYMNLAYTPQKALSLKICSAIFHQMPLYENNGIFPGNTTFGDFSVNYEQDLAILNSLDEFYYTNNNSVILKSESSLKHIAGYGHSKIVSYDGTGAYFLDKLENGAWRLEVMPDALIIDNPYGRNSLQKEVAVIQWNKRNMGISLDDLGTNFTIRQLNNEQKDGVNVSGDHFVISPGVYLLTRVGVDVTWDASDVFGNIQLGEFHAPQNSVNKTYLVHEKPELAMEGKALTLTAQIATSDTLQSVQLLISGPSGKVIDMKSKGGFDYEATISGDMMSNGFLNYYIILRFQDKVMTYPSGKEGFVYEWDFYDRGAYIVPVIKKNQPIYLFDAHTDANALSYTRWLPTLRSIPLNHLNTTEYQIDIEKLFQVDSENLNGPIINDYTLKSYLNKRLNHIRGQFIGKKKLLVRARSLNDQPIQLQVALTTSDGSSFGKIIKVTQAEQTYEILLSSLGKVNTVTMPRPYPTFLPYYFEHENSSDFDVSTIEGLQLSIGPGIPGNQINNQQGIAIVSVVLE